MECKNENCELKQEMQAIRQSTEDFMKSTEESIRAFQKEVTHSITDLDRRQTKAREHLETELRSEVTRGLMAVNSKVDKNVEATNQHLMSISSDLGEIKGAMGLKVGKDETGKLRTSVMDRIELAKKETRVEMEKIQNDNRKRWNKILFLIISLLSSGFFFMLGRYLSSLHGN